MKTIVAILALAVTATHLSAKPLKVFILAGQSNMEGHAKVDTFDYIGDDPATVPLLREMRGPDGKPRVCERVWISYLTGDGVVKHGKLTAGYGALGAEPKIGPEFTFGITMENAVDGPVLIIKTAWGGKSLHTDFRSPSAGPYELNDFQLKNYPKQEGHGIQDKPNHFREAMAAPAALPEFKGNVVAVQTAPFWDRKLGEIDANRGRISQMEWMIGTKDKNGPNPDGSMTKEQQATHLADYRAKLITPADEELWKRGASNAGYHYLGCAKTFALMGRAFAKANPEMRPPR